MRSAPLEWNNGKSGEIFRVKNDYARPQSRCFGERLSSLIYTTSHDS